MKKDDHAEYIAQVVYQATKNKYLAGQVEHGGKLWKKPVLAHALQEVLDLNTYLFTYALDQLPRVLHLLTKVMESDDVREAHIWAEQARNVLTVGNEHGIVEEELDEDPPSLAEITGMN